MTVPPATVVYIFDWISLSAYWQSVIRGLFLLIVVILQARLVKPI